jgi:N-methylhydantoinase A
VIHVGIDVGGTFTDAILVLGDGGVWQTKVPTTPADPSESVIAALRACVERAAATGAATADGVRVVHGTTVATNTVVERSGATVGLLTTSGFGDTIHIMQGRGYIAGLPDDAVTNLEQTTKPEPIVTRAFVREIFERVDSEGDVVVELNVGQARRAIEELIAAGTDAFAVSLLWSFLNSAHEDALLELVAELAPNAFRCSSNDVAPVMGEYARTNAAVINAYVGPRTERYLAELDRELADLGIAGSLSILQCTGGAVSVDEARRSPVRIIGSGPVGGTMASRNAGRTIGAENIIAADMGGTTFDVSLIVDGKPITKSASVVHQYEYSVPTIDVQSIGSGGGSIAWVDPKSGLLRVGPQSAGADPGPAAYARGGVYPTVTDCDLVVGFLDPDRFNDGTVPLRPDLAEAAVREHIAEPLGMSVLEAAHGVLTIVDFQMAELMRQVTVGSGFDPRDFVVFAYGGGGPTHAPVFARELGARQLVIPRGSTSAVWSAFGAISSDALVSLERTFARSEPFAASEIEAAFCALEDNARARLRSFGITDESIVVRRGADLQYGGQAHVVEVDIDETVTDAFAAEIPARLLARYESIFGEGTAYRQAGARMTMLRVQALAPDPSHLFGKLGGPATAPRGPRVDGARPVCWSAAEGYVETRVVDGDLLVVGDTVAGPAVIELSITTIPVHPSQSVRVSEEGDFILEFEASAKE